MIRYPHTKNKEILIIKMIYLCTTLMLKKADSFCEYNNVEVLIVQ